MAAVLALTGPGRGSAGHALGLAPWPLWLSRGCVALGAAGGLLTRLALHRVSAEGKA